MNARQGPLLSVAALLLILALIVWLSGANQVLFYAVNHAGHALPDWLWSNLTLMADTLFAVAVLLIAASLKPAMFNQSLLLLLLGTLFVHGFKQGLDIARPAAVLDRDSFYIIGQVLKNHSFPSGHSFTAMSCAGLIWLNSRSTGLGVVALIIGFAAALSRAMVGAHWPLDILVGSASGLLIAALSVWLTSNVRWLQGHGQKLFIAVLLTLAAGYLSVHQDGYPYTDPLALVMSVVAVLTALLKVWLPLARLLYRAFSSRDGGTQAPNRS